MTNSSFLFKKFKPNSIKTHLVIDFAHLYRYINFQNIVIDHQQNMYDITVLRTGFIETYLIIYHLEKIFETDQNGITTTYIDKMIQLEYDYDKTEPIDCLKRIFKKIISNIEQQIKVLKSDDIENVPPYYKVEYIGMK